MNITKNTVPFGLILGLLLPLLAIAGFFLYQLDNFGTFPKVYQFLVGSRILTHVISLCAIPNLILFFAFMSKNSELSARGVIMATFLYTFVVLILKLS